MTLILREARQCDVSLLSELGVSTYTHHFKQYWIHSEELEEFLNQEYSPQVIESSLADSSAGWYVVETSAPIGFVKVIWQCNIPGSPLQGTLLKKLYLSEGTTGKTTVNSYLVKWLRWRKKEGVTLCGLRFLKKIPVRVDFMKDRV